MSERDALLRAVCDNPDEDTPRLVFADWLQENGEEDRAEFIRLQIKSAAAPEADTLAEVGREEDLLNAHRDEWVEPLRAFESSRGDSYTFRRGFVECIAADGEALAEDGERLFALAPIRELYLNDAEEYGALAKCEWLLRLRALELKGSGLSRNFDPAPLIGSPYLANLTTLGLGGEDDNGHLDIHGIRALVASPHLGSLEALDLSGNWLNDEAFVLFLTVDNLPSLSELNLSASTVGSDERCVALAEALLTRRLRVLNLSRNRLRDESAVALASVPWIQLRTLQLSNNQIGDRGAQALLTSSSLASVHCLDLRHNLPGFRDDASATRSTKKLLQERFGDRVRL